jgi:hypothetical protein
MTGQVECFFPLICRVEPKTWELCIASAALLSARF